MSQDSETIHVSETTIASHQLVVPPGFPKESGRSAAASVEGHSCAADPSVGLGSAGALPKTRELAAAPEDPPVITEKNRIVRLDLLCNS